MPFIQGRVFAASADEAAMKIRDKYTEYRGKLTVKAAYEVLGWYEFMLELSWEDEPSE